MTRAYRYIFFKLYKYATIVESKHSTDGGIPHLIAFCSICVLMFLNIMTAFVLLNQLLKVDLYFTRTSATVIAMLFMSSNYFLFLFKGKYKNYERLFISDKRRERVRTIAFWVYVVLTFVLFFTILPLFAPPR
ncbi:hypothetical protein BXY85_1602 [Roseivirga pacifica]|uniref:Uncharacterized protein n=1 Tax=Roseivirga pacifica TaxID=1267423 RepID=A0A1I0MPE1_9BACT|nr:hypothetical protein BXY85_1602 [Roseivirga pacifica]SEV90369.1 hypothetical protein SAMN05216290_0586 [Roseivirga pacifica]